MNLKLKFLLILLFFVSSYDSSNAAIKANSEDYFVINQIFISGNKSTKLHIIIRELEFRKNDTLSVKQLQEVLDNSRENLLNTSLFNFVKIDTINLAKNRIDIKINVTERWYTWPQPYFDFDERNFNTWWETKNFDRASYGFYLVKNNFRGRMETLKLLLRFGYNEKYELSYLAPYINKKQTIGLGFAASLNRTHEVAYNTINDKLIYYKDEKNYLSESFTSSFNMMIRPNIHNSHNLELRYFQYHFNDTLLKLNDKFSYFNNPELQYLSLYYKFKNDYRDNKAYPLQGHYFDIEATKDGFGLMFQEKLDVLVLKSVYRKYWEISKKMFFASGISGKLSSTGFQPYYLQKGLGYSRDFVRGYEYYVIDGQNYAMLKTNIKYNLIPTKVKTFKFIPTEKFNKIHYALYCNIYADAAYVEDKQFKNNNSLSNEILFGSGIGLDFVTYYDKVLRFEYSINKMKESGFFIHFIAPI
ncbi:MAG: hypothetical protein K9J13_09940 [Saprospiraceae bacterium]|nr:hypothetical protein [Saprospiraceae bacterium]